MEKQKQMLRQLSSNKLSSVLTAINNEKAEEEEMVRSFCDKKAQYQTIKMLSDVRVEDSQEETDTGRSEEQRRKYMLYQIPPRDVKNNTSQAV